jgi:hypothetical protein
MSTTTLQAGQGKGFEGMMFMLRVFSDKSGLLRARVGILLVT